MTEPKQQKKWDKHHGRGTDKLEFSEYRIVSEKTPSVQNGSSLTPWYP